MFQHLHEKRIIELRQCCFHSRRTLRSVRSDWSQAPFIWMPVKTTWKLEPRCAGLNLTKVDFFKDVAHS